MPASRVNFNPKWLKSEKESYSVCVQLFATPWTIQSMEFPSPGVGSRSLLQGDLPNPGIEPRSPALRADSLPAESQGKSEGSH